MESGHSIQGMMYNFEPPNELSSRSQPKPPEIREQKIPAKSCTLENLQITSCEIICGRPSFGFYKHNVYKLTIPLHAL